MRRKILFISPAAMIANVNKMYTHKNDKQNNRNSLFFCELQVFTNQNTNRRDKTKMINTNISCIILTFKIKVNEITFKNPKKDH